MKTSVQSSQNLPVQLDGKAALTTKKASAHNLQPVDDNATAKHRRLLLKTKEVCELLGSIHPRTLARMERAGQIRSVKLLRHKLYAVEDVEALVQNLRAWNKRVA